MAPRKEIGPAKQVNIFFRLLGPGLVTGAADDDPSGIATYSQPRGQSPASAIWVNHLFSCMVSSLAH
jgi:Mn2+/Fe2+ NRAMP family transporter